MTKSEILKLAEKHCKADHCKASFYKGYREAQKEVSFTKEQFIEIYKDADKYPDLPSILKALGFE